MIFFILRYECELIRVAEGHIHPLVLAIDESPTSFSLYSSLFVSDVFILCGLRVAYLLSFIIYALRVRAIVAHITG